MIRAVTSAPPTLLDSLSVDSKGNPSFQKETHSSFRTSDGKSIRDILKMPYAANASGRFSRVQTITDTNGHKYTVKHLTKHYSPELAFDEIKHLALFLGNPFVAQILGAEIYSTYAVIVFEHIPGKTLFDWINSSPTPSEEEREHRFNEIKIAIESIHKLGYTHLDIQPSNIWIPNDPRKRAFLLDLGSMHEIGRKRKSITGTPGYYPVFGNLHIAAPNINMYAFDKLKQLQPTKKTRRGRRRNGRTRRAI